MTEIKCKACILSEQCALSEYDKSHVLDISADLGMQDNTRELGIALGEVAVCPKDFNDHEAQDAIEGLEYLEL
jgi:hypothetical protein